VSTARALIAAQRLNAETIAAQQAELRRLESALHQAEHEHMKAKAQAEAHERAARRLRQLVWDIRTYWAGGDCPDDLWNDIVDATEPTEAAPGWKHMDRIQRPETYR